MAVSFQLIVDAIIKITIRRTTVHLYEFPAKQAKKEPKLWLKNLRSKLNTIRDGAVKRTETRKE